MGTKGERMSIIVRWEEVVCGDYEGETKFCDTWDEVVGYMIKSNKKNYVIEMEDD